MKKKELFSTSERARFLIEYYKRAALKTIHIKPRSYYGTVVNCDNEEINGLIGKKIDKGDAFAVARFGANELGIMSSYLKSPGAHGFYSKKQIQTFCNNAGFFPKQEDYIDRFAELMYCSAKEIDMLGVWNLPMEDYIVKHFMKDDIMVCPLDALEPWYSERQHWSQHLQGKRVLVIHPFSETIKMQYQKHTELFPGTDILPSFELITLRAVQTAAGQKDSRFNDWFEALDYMFEQSMKSYFDIAILGCGAYGFPLAARLKKQGKTVIHLGGATQLLFGIKGRRWESMPQISRLFNSAWVRPLSGDRPDGADSIEKGCYW